MMGRQKSEWNSSARNAEVGFGKRRKQIERNIKSWVCVRACVLKWGDKKREISLIVNQNGMGWGGDFRNSAEKGKKEKQKDWQEMCLK